MWSKGARQLTRRRPLRSRMRGLRWRGRASAAVGPAPGVQQMLLPVRMLWLPLFSLPSVSLLL